MNIVGKSLLELKELIEKKEFTQEELFQYFLERSKKYNEELNAYLTFADFDHSNIRVSEKALSGIPLAIKDNFVTKNLRTTASAKVLDEFIPQFESTVTQKLKDAGSHILGKTNLDAWAHGSSTETSDYGPSKNPWDTTRAPGGSSGGSAVAVSAYLSPAAIGSETAGSIRQPASWSGVVGLKPTYGRVSRYGVIAMGSSLDCPGPMTLNVKDAAYLLGVIAGKDPYDATTAAVPVDNYVENLSNKKTFTIGITDEYFEGVENSVKQKIEDSIKIFEKMGHKVKKVKLISPKYAISVYTILQRAEVSSNLARYTGVRYGKDRTYFENEAKRRMMLGTYTLAHGYYDAYYKKAQKVRTLIIEDFKKVLKDVDVIIAPTTPITALKLGEFAKYPFFGEVMDVLMEPSTIAGLPGINVPAGFDSNNLPVGMQIIGNYFDEKSILNLAHQFEKETDFFGVIKKGVERYK